MLKRIPLSDPEHIEKTIQIIRKYNPDFRLVPKRESTLMRLLGRVMFFVPSFMTHTYTTIGNTCYYPDENDLRWDIIAHEGRHAIDFRGLPRKIFYGALYLLNDVVTVWSLIGLFLPLHYYWIVYLILFLLPLPNHSRYLFEMRAYKVNMAIEYWTNNFIDQNMIEFIVKEMSGPTYYFAWPFKNLIRKRLYKEYQNIASGNELVGDEYLKDIYIGMMESGAVDDRQ